MNAEALQHAIVVAYAVISTLRLAFYVPQITAVVKDVHGAQAISLPTWYFWCLSHAFTALYALTISSDLLMAGITWANAIGCLSIATLTQLRRRQGRRGNASGAVPSNSVKAGRGAGARPAAADVGKLVNRRAALRVRAAPAHVHRRRPYGAMQMVESV